MKSLPSATVQAVFAALLEGASQRQIANKPGIAKSSVQRISLRAGQSGLSLKDLLVLSDDEREEILNPRPEHKFIEPDWALFEDMLKKTRSLTLVRLYELYCAGLPKDVTPYTYSTFCRKRNLWKLQNGFNRLAGNVDRVPAERMEIDFVGDKIKWTDSSSHTRNSKLFVASLPYSSMLYAEAFNDETSNSWCDGIIHALEYFGGVPESLVMDNAKALIKAVEFRRGLPQPWVQALCEYYGMEPWPCRVKSPKDKNRVEAAALDCERWIIAELALNDRVVAHDLNEFNTVIRELVDKINNQPFRANGMRGSRRSRFEAEEKAKLRPLTDRAFERGDWKIVMVDKAHCIRVYKDHGHRYSVPPKYTHRAVLAWIGPDRIKIFDQDSHECIGTHKRHFESFGNKTHLLPEHLTEAEKHYRRSREDWISAFIAKGIPQKVAQQFVNTVWNKSEFSGTRTCHGVMSLSKHIKPQILTKAIAQALEIEDVRYLRIRTLCDAFDFAESLNLSLPLAEVDQDYVTVAHENIRNDFK